MERDHSLWIIAILAGIVVIGGIFFAPRGDKQAVEQSTQNTSSAASQSVSVGTTQAQGDVAKRPDDIPGQIMRTTEDVVKINLETKEIVAEIMPGVTYTYWTYNGTVPGPFLRVREGDTVEVTLTHGTHGMAELDSFHVDAFTELVDAQQFIATQIAHADEGHTHGMDGHMEGDTHAAEGHAFHSIDLHAVYGPGGGAALTQVGHDGPKTFRFKALRPGVYVYHCASPHIPTHIANGMYGMILVEPKAGMAKVDREFYIMQGELYTKGVYGELGYQTFDVSKLKKEEPEYFIFNGRVGSLTGDRAMKAKVGEKVRLYVGVGTFIPSNFHIIGGVLDSLYPEGDIVSAPHRNVQTTIIPAGGAVMVEFTPEVPGTYILVDHSLTRSIDKGAVAQIIVEGDQMPELFKPVP